MHPRAKYEAKITNYLITVKKTMPILRLKIADLHQINGKSLFYVKAPKILDCKVACICEVDKHANFQPKMLIFGGGLALRKPILVECHVKFYSVAIFVKERHGIVRQNAKLTTYL